MTNPDALSPARLAVPPGGWPLTRTELARRLGVTVSTISRALDRARHAHEADPAAPAPPTPVNPGEPYPRYLPGEFDLWWPTRPGGRAATTGRRL